MTEWLVTMRPRLGGTLVTIDHSGVRRGWVWRPTRHWAASVATGKLIRLVRVHHAEHHVQREEA